MKTRAIAIVLLAGALVIGALLHFGARRAAETGELSGLDWMAGAWVGEEDGVVMEEVWLSPAGDLMLGMHRDRFPTGGVFFEFLRIEGRRDHVVYVARPAGGEETSFLLVERGEKRAIFENPDHDYPRSISYRLDGRKLRVRIEGEDNGEPRDEEWVWKRSVLNPKS
ncbi:MAG: DUF6265 family protein [Candidatus Eisenbacteria bacterium]